MPDGLRKVAAKDGAGRIVVIEEPIPQPGPGQVQVEVRASFVSPGTELGAVRRIRENPGGGPRPAVRIFECRRGRRTGRGL